MMIITLNVNRRIHDCVREDTKKERLALEYINLKHDLSSILVIPYFWT